ncbi:hypothetical protein, partial [Paenibacillus sp. AR247]|uniref:hypothetical protein n=1 Tax=Paenibacillus sp. AR247 TaxID=1631599 RepID=UPI001C6122C3
MNPPNPIHASNVLISLKFSANPMNTLSSIRMVEQFVTRKIFNSTAYSGFSRSYILYKERSALEVSLRMIAITAG